MSTNHDHLRHISIMDIDQYPHADDTLISRQLLSIYSKHADLWVQTGGTPWS